MCSRHAAHLRGLLQAAPLWGAPSPRPSASTVGATQHPTTRAPNGVPMGVWADGAAHAEVRADAEGERQPRW